MASEESAPASHTSIDGVLLAGGLGLAGYLAYKYLYLPSQARAAVNTQATIIQAQNPGLSRTAALKLAANVLCQGASLTQGIPPQVSSVYCGFAIANVPKVGEAIGKAVGGVVSDTRHAIRKAGSGAAKLLKKIF